MATKVIPDGPGQKRRHSEATCSPRVNDVPVVRVSRSVRELYAPASTAKLTYSNIPAMAKPSNAGRMSIPSRQTAACILGLRFIGLIYLVIGFYVLFRRWTRPTRHALLPLLSCLIRSVRLQVHRRIGLAGLGRLLVQRHCRSSCSPRSFSISRSASPRSGLRTRRRWLLPVLYAPGIALLGLWISAISRWRGH